MTDTLPSDLASLNTFGVAARCSQTITIDRASQLAALKFDPERDLVLGGGSNVLLTSDVPGRVFLNRIPGRSMTGEVNGKVIVSVGAGEPWHDLVRWSLEQGLAGLENLSLIPGLAGAAPMQNIGAYGVELSSVLHRVHAWDWQQQQLRTLHNQDCEFAYRDSRFKTREPHRWLIVGLELALERGATPVLSYTGLQETLDAMGALPSPSPLEISDAIVRLRQQKLPDPVELGNAGSFFKNPELAEADALDLKRSFRDLPLFPGRPGNLKTSAAWLIQQCGWKGFRDGDAGVSEQHALVLVNYGHARGAEIAQLAERIRQSVQGRFGVQLETEPRIIHFSFQDANESSAPRGSRSHS